eukprot:TRINITY_DN50754_c0_g1_i1.p1 TRINITY_DN50754_c0_g1~~TRINITY_DN50754_c0_g1_i1.p1  ORF type:complete len:198 (-),score=29.91 TRINITY_DN50754_c0_g1_i1:231-824(-)
MKMVRRIPRLLSVSLLSLCFSDALELRSAHSPHLADFVLRVEQLQEFGHSVEKHAETHQTLMLSKKQEVEHRAEKKKWGDTGWTRPEPTTTTMIAAPTTLPGNGWKDSYVYTGDFPEVHSYPDGCKLGKSMFPWPANADPLMTDLCPLWLKNGEFCYPECKQHYSVKGRFYCNYGQFEEIAECVWDPQAKKGYFMNR